MDKTQPMNINTWEAAWPVGIAATYQDEYSNGNFREAIFYVPITEMTFDSIDQDRLKELVLEHVAANPLADTPQLYFMYNHGAFQPTTDRGWMPGVRP